MPQSLFDYFRADVKGEEAALIKQVGEIKLKDDVLWPWGGIEREVRHITPNRHTLLTYLFKKPFVAPSAFGA